MVALPSWQVTTIPPYLYAHHGMLAECSGPVSAFVTAAEECVPVSFIDNEATGSFSNLYYEERPCLLL